MSDEIRMAGEDSEQSSAQNVSQSSVHNSSRRRGLRKGLYLIPSLFTAANIGAGFYSLMASLRAFQLLGDGGQEAIARAGVLFDNAALAIGLAFVFDSLDGRIARFTKTTTEIGVQFDSIADVVTFGIAPAVLAFAWGYGSALADGSEAYNLGWFLSFMYVICGAFRLARFNVQATRPRVLAEGTAKVDKEHFVGLPIPMGAAAIAAIVHFAPTPLVAHVEQKEIYSGLVMFLVAAVSILMVSTLRYKSFKSVGINRRSTHVAILTVALIGMFIWLYSQYVLLALVAIYILHGLTARLFSFIFAPLRRGAPAAK